MGVSNRATHAIDPGAGDLWVPDRTRKPRATRVRDIEDACFESVSAPRDVFSTRPRAGTGNVFKSRITQPPAEGPIPRDFVRSDHPFRDSMTQGGRLGLFAGNNPVSAAGGSRPSMALPVVFMATCAAAVVVVWMTGGDARSTQPAARMQALSASPLPAMRSEQTEPLPDQVVTSSIPVRKSQAGKEGYSAPVPRPARIERAGSILMIRPAGN